MSQITIFMYHDVRDVDDTPFPGRYTCDGWLISCLRTQPFLRQIEHIKRNYTVITPNELLEIIASGVIDKEYALLTFDDGLRDHFHIARMLAERNLTGAFFIPVEAVTKKVMMRTHKVQYVIGEMERKGIDPTKLVLSQFPNHKHNELWNRYSKSIWANNTWPQSRVFFTNLLRDYPDKNKTKAILDWLFAKHVTTNCESLANDLYLTEDHIDDMACAGMTIGGHGYISENLTNYAAPKQEIEIHNTTDFLKSMGFDKLYFSYPNGGYNQITVDLMKKYGYLFGLTTKNKVIEDVKTIGIYELPRLDAPQKLVI